MRRSTLLFSLTAYLCFGTNLFGQGTTATILGTITDTSGAVLPEAAIQIRNVGTGASQSVMSDSQGRFRIADLSVGEYEVVRPKYSCGTAVVFEQTAKPFLAR